MLRIPPRTFSQRALHHHGHERKSRLAALRRPFSPNTNRRTRSNCKRITSSQRLSSTVSQVGRNLKRSKTRWWFWKTVTTRRTALLLSPTFDKQVMELTVVWKRTVIRSIGWIYYRKGQNRRWFHSRTSSPYLKKILNQPNGLISNFYSWFCLQIQPSGPIAPTSLLKFTPSGVNQTGPPSIAPYITTPEKQTSFSGEDIRLVPPESSDDSNGPVQPSNFELKKVFPSYRFNPTWSNMLQIENNRTNAINATTFACRSSSNNNYRPKSTGARARTTHCTNGIWQPIQQPSTRLFLWKIVCSSRFLIKAPEDACRNTRVRLWPRRLWSVLLHGRPPCSPQKEAWQW